MKSLYSKLISLVPHSSTKGKPSVPDRLDDAVNYIEELQTRVERLKDRKESMLGLENTNCTMSPIGKASTGALLSPEIVIQESGSGLEVVVVSNELGCQHVFKEIVRVLQEEGAEIVTANLSIIGDMAFHTIHCEVEDSAGNNGASARTTISDRLSKFLCNS